MKIFVAGATGAVGRRLVPTLQERGHAVTAMTRSAAKQEDLRRAGAGAVVADALDEAAVIAAMERAQPDVVVHQLTALTKFGNVRRFEKAFASTNRLRTAGTDNLLGAARATGARRFVAQSFAGWTYAREGALVKAEGSTPIPIRRSARRWTPSATSSAPSPRLRSSTASSCVTAGSTVLAPRSARAASMSKRSASAGSPSSARESASGPSFTSTTSPRPRRRRSKEAHEASTTSSTTTRRRSRTGCPSWRRRWEPSLRATSPPGSGASRSARTGWR